MTNAHHIPKTPLSQNTDQTLHVLNFPSQEKQQAKPTLNSSSQEKQQTEPAPNFHSQENQQAKHAPNSTPQEKQQALSAPNSPPSEGWQAKPDGVVSPRPSKAYHSLPYNPALRDKAKALRKAGILHEALLWRELKSGKINNLDFDRQKIIGNHIVDFYCAEKAVVFEVDGSSHETKQLEDAQRDDYLRSLKLTVIRLLAQDVLQNMAGVVTWLTNHPALTGTPPTEGNYPALLK